MNGGDNGFPSGNGENTQLSWAVCSESCFLLISLGVIGITCRLRYSTPLSIFSKGQCTSFQKKKQQLSEELYYSINRQNFKHASLILVLKTLDKERKWRSITESASLNWMACLSTLLTECGGLSGWKWFTVSSLLDGIWIWQDWLVFPTFLSVFSSHISIVTNGHGTGMPLTEQLVNVYYHSCVGDF